MKKIFLLLIVAVAIYAMADDATLHKPLQLGPKNRNQIVMQGLEVDDSTIFNGILILNHLEYDSNAHYRLHMNTVGTVVVDTSASVYNCTDVFTCIDTTNIVSTQSYVNNNAWLTTGNSGTNPATNFVGTTDSKSLVFKTKNTEAIRIDTNQNVGIGTTTPTTKFQVGNGSISLTDGSINLVEISNDGGGGLITVTDNSAYTYIASANITTDELILQGLSSIGSRLIAPYIPVSSDYFALPKGDTLVLYNTLATSVNNTLADSTGNINLYQFDSIKIQDGTQSANYVLTSDANGLASWGVTSFTTSDSATIYALTPANGTSYFCSDCSGSGVTGRIVSYFGSLWRRLKFD